ncbi:MAG: class I SAM-dependent methyltransferase [Flavobacteriaceae bacterium]|nr:class I SAM-dependent methyltransferase [Flavobacteriaceae bacterium]
MEIDKNELTDSDYWKESYLGTEFFNMSKTSVIYQTIAKNIPKGDGKTSLEIGIYPSTYSQVLGDLGYEINGIDRIELVKTAMKKWLLSNNYNVGDLICDDFFTHQFEKQYDVVSSFGFIEHFKNFEEVLQMKLSLVKKGGHIIIETPNFKGKVQRILKKLLDKKNLDIHYIPSMDFDKWRKVLENHNFEIITEEYLGVFSLQTYDQKRNVIQRVIIKLINNKKYFIRKYLLKGVAKNHSPIMIMIARKK